MSEVVRVLAILGTRPEIIKLAPVIEALRRRPDRFETLVCATGQHRELHDLAIGTFGIRPDYQLQLMDPGSDLAALTEEATARLDEVLARAEPDIVLVQGDTTSALCGALAAFCRRLAIGHVEAGLRTGDLSAPFPEEINRLLISRLARWHFAPTEAARRALLAEGVQDGAIFVTGNPGIDSLFDVRRRLADDEATQLPANIRALGDRERLLLVTSHRRESLGAGLQAICTALCQVVQEHPDVHVAWPLHPNPKVRAPVAERLAGQANITLLDPLSYEAFIWLMQRSCLVLTDSGGVQEEAPSLGKPVLVLRRATERTEGVATGNALLVGTEAASIAEAIGRLLTDDAARAAMGQRQDPYGDGRAANRIVAALEQSLEVEPASDSP